LRCGAVIPKSLFSVVWEGWSHSSWKEVKRVPKKEKPAKGADKGLHKGWTAPKGSAKEEEAGCGCEEPEEEEKED